MVANNVRIDATPEFLALILDAAQKVESHIKVIGFWLVWPLVSTIIKPESEPFFGAYSHRECLDHMIVFGEAHRRRILGAYAAYYNESRTHRSLKQGCAVPSRD